MTVWLPDDAAKDEDSRAKTTLRLGAGPVQRNWVGYNSMTWPNPDSRFRLEGGRAGHIEFQESERTGRFEWEMLVGDVDIGVWGDRFFWVDSGEPMTRQEVHRFVQELATESGARVLLTWPDGESVIQP